MDTNQEVIHPSNTPQEQNVGEILHPDASQVKKTNQPPLKTIFMVALGVSIAGIGGYLGYINFRTVQTTYAPRQASENSSPQPLITTPTPPVSTASGTWKTYRSFKNEFSVTYPSEWEIQEARTPITSAPYHGSKTSDTVKIYSDLGYIRFFSGAQWGEGTQSGTLLQDEQILISGKHATKSTYLFPAQRQETRIMEIIITDAMPYRIQALYQSEAAAIIDQMLSTFKFL